MKKPNEQYFRFPRSLLTSPAWKALNINEMRAFFRVMEEHQSRSGFVNAGQVVTKTDFVAAGIHPKHIKSSLLVLEALGIIKCTRNMGGSRNGRTPNMYRPTLLPTTPTANDATHDYLAIETAEEAERLAALHRHREKRKGRIRILPSNPKLRVVPMPSIFSKTSAV